MAILRAFLAVSLCVLGLSSAFVVPVRHSTSINAPARTTRGGPVFAGEVDITFPGNKKIKGKPGDSLKALAAKAKANINYGCEEGKCGACEAVGSDGKKYRICVAKVPKTDKPIVLK